MTQNETLQQYIAVKSNPTLALMNELKRFELQQKADLKEFKQELLEKLEEKITEKVKKIEKKEMPYAEVVNKAVNNAVSNILKEVKGEKGDAIKGDDGYTPIKGQDYFTEQEIKEIISEIQRQIKLPENGITPIKGVDYPSEKQIRDTIKSFINQIEIKQPNDGKTPIKGIDYFTRQDIESIASQIKSQITFPEIKELEAKDIRDKLQSLPQFERLDASAIKGLDRYIKKETQTNIIKFGGGGRRGGGGMSMNGWEVNELVGIGDNLTVAFTLDFLPYDATKVELWVGNAKQFQGDEYTISGKNITFIVVPPTDYKIFATYYH